MSVHNFGFVCIVFFLKKLCIEKALIKKEKKSLYSHPSQRNRLVPCPLTHLRSISSSPRPRSDPVSREFSRRLRRSREQRVPTSCCFRRILADFRSTFPGFASHGQRQDILCLVNGVSSFGSPLRGVLFARQLHAHVPARRGNMGKGELTHFH